MNLSFAFLTRLMLPTQALATVQAKHNSNPNKQRNRKANKVASKSRKVNRGK